MRAPDSSSVLVAGSLSGCGVLDDERPAVAGQPDPAVYGPPRRCRASSRSPPSCQAAAAEREVARALTRGEIGVVDPGGVVSIEPRNAGHRERPHAAGAALDALGRGRRRGRGTAADAHLPADVRERRHDRVPRAVTLSGVKTCDGRRYFERGEVRIDPEDTPAGGQPATYLRAPC